MHEIFWEVLDMLFVLGKRIVLGIAIGIAITIPFLFYMILNGELGLRCDRIYPGNYKKHDDYCYLSRRPKELRR